MPAVTAVWPEVQARIDQIKTAHRVRHLTNCFAPPPQPSLLMLSTASAVAFASQEHDFHRLYYFGASVDAVAELLAAFPGKVVIGYVDKAQNESLCAAFRKAGFNEKAHYRRMTNAELPKRTSHAEPAFARLDEATSLSRLLADTFDPMTDHLPEAEQLRTIVAAQQALVSRTDGQLTGAIVFQQPSKLVHYNFLVNRSHNMLHLMTLQNSFYHVMVQRGITSGFLWVDSRNSSIIAFHEAYGWKCDGLNDWFYTREAP